MAEDGQAHSDQGERTQGQQDVTRGHWGDMTQVGTVNVETGELERTMIQTRSQDHTGGNEPLRQTARPRSNETQRDRGPQQWQGHWQDEIRKARDLAQGLGGSPRK